VCAREPGQRAKQRQKGTKLPHFASARRVRWNSSSWRCRFPQRKICPGAWAVLALIGTPASELSQSRVPRRRKVERGRGGGGV
jgi:hypothetical protein